MDIETDVQTAVDHYYSGSPQGDPADTHMGRSIAAYVELSQFDRAGEAVRSNERSLLEFLSSPDSGRITLAGIVRRYLDEVLTQEACLEELAFTRTRAEALLRADGFDPDVETEASAEKKAEHERAVARVAEAMNLLTEAEVLLGS